MWSHSVLRIPDQNYFAESELKTWIQLETIVFTEKIRQEVTGTKIECSRLLF